MTSRSRRLIGASFALDVPFPMKGAGNAGRAVRIHSLVRKMKNTRVSTPQVAGSPGIPRAMVLTASSALSLVNRAFLPPS
jgi:hypothetical protein